MQRIDRQRVMADEAFLERIERRGADVAEHHAQRTERKRSRSAMRRAILASGRIPLFSHLCVPFVFLSGRHAMKGHLKTIGVCPPRHRIRI